jgi:hypothetical protein
MTRWYVISVLGFPSACAAPVMAAPPALELVATIDMPGVKGRIDHLDADSATHRLFVAALGNDSVEVLDTTGHGRPERFGHVAAARRALCAGVEPARRSEWRWRSGRPSRHRITCNRAPNRRHGRCRQRSLR